LLRLVPSWLLGHRGLTLEFQHSYLNPDQQDAREAFYGNMAWVVDGSRLAGDLPRFLKGHRSFLPIWRNGVYVAMSPEEAFPRNWLSCAAPVFFDFGNAPNLTDAMKPIVQPLWCLLPGRVFGMAVVLRVSRESFLRWAKERSQLLPTNSIVTGVTETLVKALQVRQAQVARLRKLEVARHARRKWRPEVRRRRAKF
jgi:hypothetical protein